GYGREASGLESRAMTKSPAELVAEAKARIKNLDVDQFAAAIDDGALVVDVREPQERIDSGVIPGSINVPLGTLEAAATPSNPAHRAELDPRRHRSEEHTSELQSPCNLV